jgi:hypothetical protein
MPTRSTSLLLLLGASHAYVAPPTPSPLLRAPASKLLRAASTPTMMPIGVPKVRDAPR